ncbi:MAG TPA: prepilin-type N-terminal cleavage/methylation domain-containing protein [Phycisphaeraceae bacterium]
MRGSAPRGFTMIELLVVISIIALMISILLPALKQARMAALTTECSSTLRQVGIAIYTYANDHSGKLPLVINPSATDNNAPYWWQYLLSFYLETNANPLKAPVHEHPVYFWRCPVDDPDKDFARYAYNARLGYADTSKPFLWNNPVTLTMVKNPSDMITVADSVRDATWWGFPSPFTPGHFDYTWSRHSGRTNILFLDGHVELMEWEEYGPYPAQGDYWAWDNP